MEQFALTQHELKLIKGLPNTRRWLLVKHNIDCGAALHGNSAPWRRAPRQPSQAGWISGLPSALRRCAGHALDRDEWDGFLEIRGYFYDRVFFAPAMLSEKG
jgi:hypothetical protein